MATRTTRRRTPTPPDPDAGNTLYRRLAQHGLDLPSAGAPPRVPPPLPGDFARTSPDAAPSKGDR